MRTSAIATIIAAAIVAASPAAHALELTPAQTEGPYYPQQKPLETDTDLTRIGDGPVAKGDVLSLKGRVLDPTGAPIPGARVEIWQTDHQGIYLHPGDNRTAQRDKTFQFYGETRSAENGAFEFRTIVPALYPGRPRHIHAKITPPGGATLTTQFYFKGDAGLERDGIARRLGKALESVTLSPKPTGNAPSGPLEATVDVVVKK
ncbi:MAG: protocatechuate 3,4-dioxygenase [Hyphomicrobiaceae bacterium]